MADAAPQPDVEPSDFETSIPEEMFVKDLDYTCEFVGDDVVGQARITDELRPPGSRLVRPSVLATLGDVIAGRMATVPTAPRLALTLDIGVRILTDDVPDEIDMAATILKAGRGTVVTETEFRETAPSFATGRLVAISQLTFVPSPRPEDLYPPMDGPQVTRGTMRAPLPEHVGTRLLAPGVVEIDRTPFVSQLSGTLQGGIVALLGELAAESLLGAPIRDLETNYLTTIRVGPGRATATLLGRGLARVEVHDAGNDDRFAALVLARTEGSGDGR